jgi:hypothetical protein
MGVTVAMIKLFFSGPVGSPSSMETDIDGGKKRKAACEQEDDAEGAGEQEVPKAEKEEQEKTGKTGHWTGQEVTAM